jgi:hypothetical protein
MKTGHLLFAEHEQHSPDHGEQTAHNALACPQRECRERLEQMDQHQDQEQPASGGDPNADAQRHHRAYGFPELDSNFVFCQRQLLPQKRLSIMHQADKQLGQSQFSVIRQGS